MTVFAVEYVYDAESSEARAASRPSHREWTAGLAQAADESALNDILKQDPFASAGVISGTRTTEWVPVTGLLADHA
jgi:uncharacterized protein YciI